MADFLLELRSEEIPARMQAKARNELARMFAECTQEAGLTIGSVETFRHRADWCWSPAMSPR